ncbi:hypothetical protein MIMGU_mgv11b024632mg, partial [Erythranthe guttata]
IQPEESSSKLRSPLYIKTKHPPPPPPPPPPSSLPRQKKKTMAAAAATPRLKDELDIVIPTIRNLDFLDLITSSIIGTISTEFSAPRLHVSPSKIPLVDALVTWSPRRSTFYTIDDDCFFIYSGITTLRHRVFAAVVLVKVICDHLNLGVKTGLRYIWHSKASDPFVNLKKEYKGIYWQEDIIPFFQSVSIPKECTTVQQCYIELAKQVKAKLSTINPYFTKLADTMVTWIESVGRAQPFC